MHKWVFYFGLMAGIGFARAQTNLVPNPSFEAYNQCPNLKGMDMSQDTFPSVKDWFELVSNCLYFNSCASSDTNSWFGVPFNGNGGYCPAQHGNAFIATLCIWSNAPDFRSAATTKLESSLKLDVFYKVVFYTRPFRYFGTDLFSITSIGCKFSSTADSVLSKNYFDTEPQILSDTNVFIDDTTQWVRIEGLFKAKGGEQYITLGNFYRDNRTYYKIITRGNQFDSIGFYAFDNVSVTEFAGANPVIIDTILCLGDTLTLTSPLPADSCIWFNGSRQQTLTTAAAGNYWVTRYYHTRTEVFAVTDTFKLHLFNPVPNHTDTIVCNAKSVLLTANHAPRYLWSTNDTTQSIIVNQSGLYTVHKLAPTCSATDSFTVLFASNPNLNFIKDTVVCFKQANQIILDAGIFAKYDWQPTGETSRYIYSTKAQPYLLTVTDSNNCTASKAFEVLETCPFKFMLPNAFSPNADGVNDVLIPAMVSINQFQMTVINRWGQVVFTTNNTTIGWDGTNAPDGVYLVQVDYTPDGLKPQSLTQYVTLLR